MKQKGLEILLQKVPQPTNPTPTLEQYMTPASIAADIIFNAYQFGDIDDKIIVDLGCGTGIFSIGVAILGAKKIIGFDVDKESIQLAKKHAEQNTLEIDFMVTDVDSVQTKCDTVLMNPPFGAQKSNQKADRKFIEKGFEIADIIYSIHLATEKTRQFLTRKIPQLGGVIMQRSTLSLMLQHTYDHQQKKRKKIQTDVYRIVRKR